MKVVIERDSSSLQCDSSKGLLYTQTSVPPSPRVIRPNALWSDIHTPSITSVTFHFIKSSVHLMVRLRYRAMCERTTVDDELNMAGLNIDLVGQRFHYSVSFHNLLTSSDITAWLTDDGWLRILNVSLGWKGKYLQTSGDIRYFFTPITNKTNNYRFNCLSD